MRIAVCDDERAELQGIASMLEELAGQGRLPLGPLLLRSYQSAAELLADAEAGARFDLLILDVLMPGMDGIELARRLRARGDETDIVFLTSSKEFAVDSYEVRATDYLVKPVAPQRLVAALERVLQKHARKEEMLVLSTPFKLVNVPCAQIEFVEIRGKTLHFMLLGGREELVNAPLKDYEPQLLGKGGFVKVHRSFIVNMANIKTLALEGVRTVEGRQVPVSRSLRKAVRETYMAYLFDDAGGSSA
ncbi:MAG: LytR/AlgR family response regulator transcription factor [Coriobacteriales bacterium]